MSVFGHLADTHLGHRQYGLRQREDDMVSTAYATVKEMVTDHGVEAIVLPGDLFHARDIRPKILADAERVLDSVPEDIPVLVSRGNHDENLTPRQVTWLKYLHQKGKIILLEADLESNSEAAVFTPHDTENLGSSSGFYDLETDEGLVRFFGLQWRGARVDTALQQVAAGIQETNDSHGQPDFTVLLAHFGIEDEVPTLGGTVTHAELREVKEVVDYLALGHIHKRYDSAGWIYNPGSPEAHNTREGRTDWEHGYYTVTLSDSEGGTSLSHRVSHCESKRRPYFTIDFDVTGYKSQSGLEEAFRSELSESQYALNSHLQKPLYLSGGSPREPIVDLRFTGTLQFGRADFRTGTLAEWAEEECGALYVQTNTGIRTANVQALLSEIEDGDVFVDGRLNTALLERRVFETIAEESVYNTESDAVADVLERAHHMAQRNESPEDIRVSVTEKRRELFETMVNDVVVDLSEDPFAREATEEQDQEQEVEVVQE